MYTLVGADGKRNLVLEHGLGQLESKFCIVRDTKLETRQRLNDDERLILCAFVAAMDARTTARRDHHKAQWGKSVELMDRMQEKIKNFTPEEREQARRRSRIEKTLSDNSVTLSGEEVRRIASQPVQEMLTATINTLAPRLLAMDMVVIETNTEPGFITSDNPCVWFDPEAYKRPPMFQTPGLGYETTEITLPISPNQMLIFRQKLRFPELYTLLPLNVVDELNRRTRFNAYEYFVVNSNTKKDWWFDSGVEPEDSWNKLHSKLRGNDA